jgi:hypothetical protein
MSGSTECNQEELGKKTSEENYYTKRYKFALDGLRDVPSSLSAPAHWRNDDNLMTIHNTVLDTATEKTNLLNTMQAREAEVAKCVNELIAYQQLENTQATASDATQQALRTAENERDKALRAYNNMLSERDSKARIVEINTYYSKQYDAYTNIFKIVFFACIPLVLLGMLNKEGLIDSGSYFRFSMLVIVIGFLMTAYRINDMYWRNNLNYDNYDWLYDTPVKDQGTWEYKKRKEASEGILLGDGSSTCQGSSCCYDGTYWNGTSCFPNPSHGATGKYYYCAADSKYTVLFTPSGDKSGTVGSLAFNGTYSISGSNNETITFTRELERGETTPQTHEGIISNMGGVFTITWTMTEPIHTQDADGNDITTGAWSSEEPTSCGSS